MKNINIIALIIALLITGFNQLMGGEYSPMDVKTITLKNGLTVYLNEDHNTTSVFGAVVVNGGGKRDPNDATGIAHYLEHLLFKGTEEMGTVNFEAEQVYLDSIRMKYDVLAATHNEDKRLEIQKEINRLSLQAGEYAIPNEFDRLLEGMGGTWINAFTSDDVIAYFNKFPGDQMEKWLEIYSHRFEKPVFRLFQAELETVYEEKNRAMDNVFRNVFVTYLENFFKKHPYGQQTVLGSVEHLKNPSLTKMQEYFDTYYVANNMALIISGDFSIEEAIPLIEQKFGNWRSGELPPPIDIVEDPFEGREKISKRMTPIKFGIMGFRTVPAGHPDEIAINIANQLLTNNANTGLINQLTVDGKILEAGAFTMDYADLGANNFIFIPKLLFQSLNKAEKLVLGEIERLKAGDFNDDFFNAVKLTMIRQHEENMESMEGRLFTLIDAHVKGRNWDDIITLPEKINTITKEEVIAIANTYFGDDYLVMHSKMGFPKKHKLDKPSFEPIIPKNTEKKSAFATSLEEVPEGELKLKYIEFNKDVEKQDIMDRVHLYRTHNPINGIFTLNFQYGIGTKADPKLQQTAELLNLLGTEEKDFHTFKSELQKIGTTIDFRADKNYFKIQVKGFDTHFEKSLEYVSEIMTKVKGDDSKIKNLVNNAKAGRKMEKKEPSNVGRALRDYALYGTNSPYLTRMTVKEIKKSNSEDFLNAYKEALKYEVDILYTGKNDIKDVSSKISENIYFGNDQKDAISSFNEEIQTFDEDRVYLLNDKKAVQSQIYFAVNGNPVDDGERSVSKAYNKYFGRGMGSIIFQEIREFRSLAYSCRAAYNTPFHNGNKGYFSGFIGCQADKSIEAISVFKDLALNMPEKEERIEQIKSGLVKSINANRPGFRSYPSWVSSWVKQGYSDDPRKNEVEFFRGMTFENILSFQKKTVSNKAMAITIVTDKRQIDLEQLSEYGEIITLKKKDIFN